MVVYFETDSLYQAGDSGNETIRFDRGADPEEGEDRRPARYQVALWGEVKWMDHCWVLRVTLNPSG